MKLHAALFSLSLALVPARGITGEFERGLDAAAVGNFDTALALWRPLAEAGHVDAQFNLGLMYDNGVGVPQNLERAARWYRAAAEAGDRTAQAFLAEMYANGQGVGQSDAQAAEWYEKAALNCETRAQYNLGIMYASGRGVPLNDVYAIAWLSVAEGSGQPASEVIEAMVNGMPIERILQAAEMTRTLMQRCGLD